MEETGECMQKKTDRNQGPENARNLCHTVTCDCRSLSCYIKSIQWEKY